MALVWLAATVLTCAGAPLPATLLEQSLTAAKKNTARSVNWLAQEDIRRYDLKRGRRRTSWTTYEASKVEGENYYRLVGRNGKPLSKDEIRNEQFKLDREAALRRSAPTGQRRATPDRRYSVSVRQILDHHSLQLSGEDLTSDGRKIWIVDTRVRDGAPEPVTHGDLALAGDATLWIDQETKLIAMQEVRLKRVWEQWGPGSFVRYEMKWNGEVMLVQRILVRVESSLTENEQVYTNYRKFGADATVTFEVTDPPER